MEITGKQIKAYLKAHPEKKHRHCIPSIVEELTGVPPEKQVEVKVAIRRLQEEIPNDEFGQQKEKDWRKERGMQSGLEVVEEIRKEFVINGQKMRVKV